MHFYKLELFFKVSIILLAISVLGCGNIKKAVRIILTEDSPEIIYNTTYTLVNSSPSNEYPRIRIEDIGPGSVVEFFTRDDCTGSKIGTARRNGELVLEELSDGGYNFYIINSRDPSSCLYINITYTLDTVASVPVFQLSPSNLSPSNNNNPFFQISGLERKSTVSIYSDSACSNELKSQVVDSTEINLQLANPITEDALHYYHFQQVDRFGNISQCSLTALEYDLDTTPPLPPSLQLNTPSPSQERNPAFTLSMLDLGGSAAIYSDRACSNELESFSISSETISFSLSSAITLDGRYAYYTKQTDWVKNESTCSSLAIVYILNTIYPSEISSGWSHTCAKINNDLVKCWGDNQYGQLGVGITENLGDQSSEMGNSLNFINLGTESNDPLATISISSGAYYNCALLSNNRIKCWGDNGNGQLGKNNSNNDDQRIGDQANEMGDNLHFIDLGIENSVHYTVNQISTAAYHACAIVSSESHNRRVKCWGQNQYGQIGNEDNQGDNQSIGDQDNEMGNNLDFVNLGLENSTHYTVDSMASGVYHTCAILNNSGNKQAKCWGRNNYGQLGIGSNQGDSQSIGDQADEMGDNLSFVDLGSQNSIPYTVIALTAGLYHTCALLSVSQTSSRIKCWGRNNYGQLGIGNNQGDNQNIGDQANEMGNNLSFIDIGSQDSNYYIANMVIAGANHTCSTITSPLINRKLKCWGQNQYGQLGLGNTQNIGDQANQMGNNLDFIDLGTENNQDNGIPYSIDTLTASGYQVCAILRKRIKCWGYNNNGQLGLSNTRNIGDNSNEMGNNLLFVNLGDANSTISP